MTVMDTAAIRLIEDSQASGALIGTADPVIAQRLPREFERLGRKPPALASTFAHLRQRFVREAPVAVLIDASLLRGAPLEASLRQFAPAAPIVLLGPLSRQMEAAPLVAEGIIEFVAREGNFFALAAGLMEHRLRTAAPTGSFWGPSFGEWRDIGEIFRHEINNPLTGILGNAELLLAHHEHLTAMDTQRLETVVDLAVRLRETTRRLSNAWEASQVR